MIVEENGQNTHTDRAHQTFVFMFWGYQDDCTFGIDVPLYFSAITRNTLHNRGSVIAHRKIGGIKDQLISIKIQTSKTTLTSTKAANQLFSTSTRSLFYDCTAHIELKIMIAHMKITFILQRSFFHLKDQKRSQ